MMHLHVIEFKVVLKKFDSLQLNNTSIKEALSDRIITYLQGININGEKLCPLSLMELVFEAESPHFG